jgi:hypothetical protein
MSPYKRPSRYDAWATSELAQRRVAAVLACLKVLCPSADLDSRRELASKILVLAHGEDHPVPRKMITPAAVYEIFTRNNQYVLNQKGKCPLLVFTELPRAVGTPTRRGTSGCWRFAATQNSGYLRPSTTAG